MAPFVERAACFAAGVCSTFTDMADCEHIGQIRDVSPNTKGCVACEREGKSWVALRKCLVCGHVGCCDSTPGQHARAHFAETGHPLIEPIGGGSWKWCYVDDTYVQR